MREMTMRVSTMTFPLIINSEGVEGGVKGGRAVFPKYRLP